MGEKSVATANLRLIARSVAALGVTAVAFTTWGPVAQADTADTPRAAWSPGPEVDLRKPALLRLSAERLLALRVAPRACGNVNVQGACNFPVYDTLPAAIINLQDNSTKPAAGLPDDMKLGSQAATVAGDVYIPATDYSSGSAVEVLLKYVSAKDRWDTLALPPGVESFGTGFGQLIEAAGHLVVLIAGSDNTQKSAGAIMESNGRWRTLPANPLQKDGSNNIWGYGTSGEIVTTRTTEDRTLIATLAISSEGRPAAKWRRLQSPSVPVSGRAQVIGDRYLTWPQATYDLRTGRTTLNPKQLYQKSLEQGPRIVRDGMVIGDWYTLGDALFNPATRMAIPLATAGPLPHPQDYDAYETCSYLGGPTNLIRRCAPKDKTYSMPPDPLASRASGGPDVYEVLRVADGAAAERG